MNETLVTKTLLALIRGQIAQFEINAGIFELLANGHPNLSTEQKTKLIAHSKHLHSIAQTNRSEMERLFTSLQQ